MSEIMVSDQILSWVVKAALAVVIFYVGRKIAKWLSELLAKQMSRQGLDEMLVRLVMSTAYIVLLAVVVLAALEQLGINTTSALAIFGAAGLAVGLALKDSLSNFAAGVLIVFFKPFDIGHYIEAAGTAGSVVEVGMFNTTLVTPDNKRVVRRPPCSRLHRRSARTAGRSRAPALREPDPLAPARSASRPNPTGRCPRR